MIGQKNTIPKSDIKSRTVSDFSMMPAGLLQTLKNDEVVALFKYMQTKQQVPLSK
jgi:cytochrome c5